MNTRQGQDPLDPAAPGAPEPWLRECSSLHGDLHCPRKTAALSRGHLWQVRRARAQQGLGKVSTDTLEAFFASLVAKHLANSFLTYFHLSAFVQGDAQRKDLQLQNRDSAKF